MLNTSRGGLAFSVSSDLSAKVIATGGWQQAYKLGWLELSHANLDLFTPEELRELAQACTKLAESIEAIYPERGYKQEGSLP